MSLNNETLSFIQNNDTYNDNISTDLIDINNQIKNIFDNVSNNIHEFSYLLGNDYAIQINGIQFDYNISDYISNEQYKKCFNNLSNKKISIISSNQTLDLNQLINRMDIYHKLDVINNLITKEYKLNNIVESIIIKKGFTYISALKNMSKDVYFDNYFKNNPLKFADLLLDSIKLITDSTIYNDIHFNINELNLNKLNIGIINMQDQYVSYQLSEDLTDSEIDFIKNKCLLQFIFINKYNSNERITINKNLLIG